jgi:hypothetical protein
MSWDSRFFEPIELPDGVKLASLREAIVHLVNTVPSSERGIPVILTAAEADNERGRTWRPDRVRAHRDTAGAQSACGARPQSRYIEEPHKHVVPRATGDRILLIHFTF